MEPYASPKSSTMMSANVSAPVGVGAPSQNESGNLKLSIALGQKPTIIQKGPFYLMKPEPVIPNEVTGAANLMSSKGLEHSYVKLTTKKLKDSLSSFLPQLPGLVDTPGARDNSSLRMLIDKPPVCGKELQPLSALQLSGFRLHPGPLPENYRLSMQMQTKRKRKHKKNRHKGAETPATDDQNAGSGPNANGQDEREKRKEKKHKKHEKDAEERKKKKKEKKKKRSKEDKDNA